MNATNLLDPSPNEMAANTARMAALLEAAVDGIISIDQRGVVHAMNPAAERLFGYDKREVVGRNVSMLMPAPYAQEHDAYLGRYLRTGEKRIIGIGREVVGLRKDGSTFPIELSVGEARVGEEVIFVGFVRDITERKLAEESLSHLAALVESSEDAIVSKSLDGTILTWNKGAERMFGYTANEAIGRHISMLAPPDRPCEVNGILERIRRGESVGHQETVRVRKDGRRIDVFITISPIKDGNGNVLAASSIKRDITDQKRVNEELRGMTQQVWQAAKLASVGELAASIAHELNNPLATVTLRIESILSRTPAEDPRRRPLEIIQQEVQRMGDLVANLLQFSRRGADQISTVDICQELNKTVELVQHHLRKHRITVKQEFAPELPAIFADRQKLRQVFLNIVTNASDAMPQGGTLTLRAQPAVLPNCVPGVLLEFVDTGDGIPTEHLDKVMEPFFTTKEEGKGTGLGLAICRRIVQEHNGILQIASRAGEGTTVRAILPVKNVGNVQNVRRD
jgi:PAS domain S-box-containing protein